MQITVDGVKIKPFIFICFSIACNNIWHSDYDCGRVQTLTAMIGTLSDQCFSQWNAKWDSLLICRLAIVAIQAVIVDRLFGPVTFRAQDQWHFFSHLFLHLLFIPQDVSEPELPAVLPPALQGIEELSEAVEGLRTVEEVMRYLEPERWQVDMEELYKLSWHVLGKSFIHSKKARGRTFWMDFWKGSRCWGQCVYTHVFFVSFWGGADLNLLRDEVRLYSCTPRNFSVSLREELKRTDAIFWPSCLLVNRCGGNCACCSHRCYDCQCVPARVTKKYHEVNANT